MVHADTGCGRQIWGNPQLSGEKVELGEGSVALLLGRAGLLSLAKTIVRQLGSVHFSPGWWLQVE